MSKKAKIPTIIGIIILIIGLATGVLLVQNYQVFKLGARGATPPKDVRISNISDSSFTISWISEKESTGFVLWGSTASNLTNTESDEIGRNGFTHSVTVRALEPQKTYFFKINSDGNEYDNNKIPWQVTLGPSISPSGSNYLISGTVLTATGIPSVGSLVYVLIGGVSPITTTTSDTGSWVVNLSQTRVVNLDKLYSTASNDLIEIAVSAGAPGTSSAQIHLASAKPVPPLILGQVHDFKSLPASKDEALPLSTIQAPQQTASQESRFNLSGTESTPKSTSAVTLDSIDEGEVVTSTHPEFFGKGPKGAAIKITVESEDPVSASAKIGSTGSWKWSSTQDLTPGSHTVTISWRDENGVLKTLTKNFIVQAAEGPAFVSTPSASLTPTPKVSATPHATGSSTPKAKATSTATASATPKTPDSGTLTPTIIMLIMGLVLLTLGGSIFASALKET